MVVYDPRDNVIKESDNPALIYADIALNQISKKDLEDDFYLKIINMANRYDEIVQKD